ncbi:MAG: transcriptional regulator NanR [Acidobacteria bacterium]|nr:transcriptional regulator NanR [Acidobacteriota bacterium]
MRGETNKSNEVRPRPLIDETPASKRKLSDEVLDRLTRLIESGSIRPGEQLPSERELMGVYRVGRPAVREALQSLEQMGMISINHGERARVISLTPDTLFEQMKPVAGHLLSSSPETLENLKQARLMFEQAMVRLAVANANAGDIGRLRESLKQLAGAPHGTPKFIAADMLFHETIASISGNPLFASISKAMLDWLQQFSLQIVHKPGRESITVAEHEAILERIAARDEEGAVTAMCAHLTRANELYHTLRATSLQRKGK